MQPRTTDVCAVVSSEEEGEERLTVEKDLDVGGNPYADTCDIGI
jgi:hypothetical protein